MTIFLHILQAETITLGGKQGWAKLSLRRDVTEGTGRFGYSCMQLATDSRTRNIDTDLLVDFEQQPPQDISGKYIVVSNHLGVTTKSVMGKEAALCRGNGGIKLKGNAASLFGNEGPTGSFYMEFWLSPSVSENGEIIFDWRSSRNISRGASRGRNDSTIAYQTITGVFYKNHLEWTFTNVFDGYQKEDVVLDGMKTLIPDKWSHHVVSFDEESGRLEYRVDGELEDIKYITASGHESGTAYQVYLGVPADIEFCPKFTGKIDDIRIQRGTYDMEKQQQSDNASGLTYSKYKISGGRIETEPLMTSIGSRLDSVTAVMNEPPQTAVVLYARSGDNFFNWTDTYPAWVPIKNGEKISSMSGLYFQVAADLYPDGNCSVSPSITQLSVNYSTPPDPLPPFRVKAVPGDGCVTLSWSYSVDETAGSYLVYYGTRPGEYLGRAAFQGNSPIDAGNKTSMTITGLKNGTIYYFAVSTCSKFDTRINGQLSQEVYARPAAGD